MPAAAAPWVSAGLGALGLLEGSQRNREAQNQANDQFALQKSEIDRQNLLFDTLMRLANQANAAGQFDPTKRLQLLNQEVNAGRTAADASAAGAARTLGYKPGDTVPLDTINQIHGNFGLQLRQLANDIYNQSFQQKLAAYSAANPSSLNAAIAATGDNARFDWSKMQPLSGLLGSVMPFLNGGWQSLYQGQSSTPTANPLAMTLNTYNPDGTPTGNPYPTGYTSGYGGGGAYDYNLPMQGGMSSDPTTQTYKPRPSPRVTGFGPGF